MSKKILGIFLVILSGIMLLFALYAFFVMGIGGLVMNYADSYSPYVIFQRIISLLFLPAVISTILYAISLIKEKSINIKSKRFIFTLVGVLGFILTNLWSILTL